ncbi:MAG: diguanylate cyclase [Treponema sp.]|nr:diguanylate cyclase [Treponema sp.]MCL2251571.1 diguanylate cyclase [Treponema sp.]
MSYSKHSLNINRSTVIQLLFVWLAFFLMVLISYLFVSDIVHNFLTKEAADTLSYTQSKINDNLRDAETILHNVSQSILIMILQGNSADLIHEHMIEITDYLSSDVVRISAFNGLYGFFNVFGSASDEGIFLDGTGWIPPEGYKPMERPWYQAAVAAGTGIAVTNPYIALLTSDPVISYSRQIHDRDGNPLGVVAVDVQLDKMAEYVVNTKLAEGGYGILITDNLEILASPSKEYLGKHLSELPHKNIDVVVSNLEKGSDIFEHIVTDDLLGSEYNLFTRKLENGWHIGIFTPVGKFYQQVTGMRIFISILGISFAFALSFVLLHIVDAKRKAEKKAGEAYFDSLTGIYNRRYFEENLNKLMKLLSRSGDLLSLMLIDIDHFKKYNDTYGHSEGDKCLITVADVLSKTLTRDTDFIARYGGEEFVVVLPNANMDGACIIAEKLIQNMHKQNILHENSETASFVTISIGVVTGSVNHKQNSVDFVKQADKMLYLSKHEGRNRFNFSKL